MGATGSGKSTFINMVSGSHLPVGDGLRSCTSDIELSEPFALAGRTVVMIDTPGFDDTTRSDTDVLKMIATFLSRMYQDGHKLSGIVYTHRISDFRVTGMSRRNFTLFRKLCGEDTLQNVIIATTMWSEVSAARGIAREDELATENLFFRPVLDKGARMMRHDNSYASAMGIVMQLLPNRRRTLLIQRELVDMELDIAQTTAGAELSRDLGEQAREKREEMEKIEQERQEALLAADIQSAQELEDEHHEAAAKIKTIENKQMGLAGTLVTLLAAGAVSLLVGQVIAPRHRRDSS
ncbi:hypothetical protein WOLCODRAFT_27316 [Wolfiporia cocos MD-104 SS10]|uniref:G domain-containing protein n=1 Tax=Wolfiporia cocos (strain MD-104) TaxID=742152 RepID=A0A2H3IX94_WOLCO|nr:hypothetical protein WOLCODRAFT_27316 [Wolfiporia cocos MD-104 SS10]